jgi:tetratricopeptide (TPR) repeat protein
LQLLRSELCAHLYGDANKGINLLSVRPSAELRHTKPTTRSSGANDGAAPQTPPHTTTFTSSSFSVHLPFNTPLSATTPSYNSSSSIPTKTTSSASSALPATTSASCASSSDWVSEELGRMERHDGHSLYLLGIILNRLQQRELAKRALILSLTLTPVNWSGWQLLSDLCESRAEADQLLSVHFRTATKHSHWMAVFFRAHVLLALQENEECLAVLGQLCAVFAHTTVLLELYALVYYQQRDYDEAERRFVEMRKRDPFRLQNMDIYSNILYVTEKKAELSHLAMQASRIDYYRPETCCILGNYYSLKMYHEKAVLYFQRALKVGRVCVCMYVCLVYLCVVVYLCVCVCAVSPYVLKFYF